MITLRTLVLSTAQQVFDQVADHLLAQGEKSMLEGKCVYNNHENLKCAAGCLIGDDEYDDLFEGNHWFELVNSEKVPKAHDGLIRGLQTIHDQYTPCEWLRVLANFALEHDLEFKHNPC